MSIDYLEGDEHLLALTAILALWRAELTCREMKRLHAGIVEGNRQMLMHTVNPIAWTREGVKAQSPGRLPDGAEEFTDEERGLLVAAGRLLIRCDGELSTVPDRRRDQFGRSGALIAGWGEDASRVVVPPLTLIGEEAAKPDAAISSPVVKARGAALLRHR